MREDFCAFILTNSRPNNVITYAALNEFGYTGKCFLVVDDEDKSLPEYIKRYSDKVLVFSKRDIEGTFDKGDNFENRRSVIYARIACFDLAKKVGCKYFIQLDDDYTSFYFRFDNTLNYGVWRAECLDDIFEACIKFADLTNSLSICFSQGGDHIGGAGGAFGKSITARRKAMNTFICSTDRPFKFCGRLNDDVNTYLYLGFRGELFFTIVNTQVNQLQTQSNPGGMTEVYLDSGTYVKSFYSIMYAPSCVKIGLMGRTQKRLHHRIDWDRAVPKIIRQDHKKAVTRS